MKINEILNENSISVDNKKIDMISIEIENVMSDDYPDFSDAFIAAAAFEDGTQLTDDQLDQLTNDNDDLVNRLAHEKFQ